MSCSSASYSPSSSSSASSTWADLPIDILVLLVRSMHSSLDRLRFGAVCRSWRDVAAAVKQNLVGPCDVAPLPLMTFRDPADGVLKGGGAVEATPVTRCFYSLSEDKVYRLRVPSESRDWRCFGCSRGWLGMIDLSAKPFLFDPISGARVDLPSLATLDYLIPRSKRNRDGETLYLHRQPNHDAFVYWITATDVRDTFINRLALSSSPLDDPNCIVMITVSGWFRLPAYTRPGDDAWVQVSDLRKACWYFHDIVYHEGAFYALVGDEEVITITFGHPNSLPSVQVLVPALTYTVKPFVGYYLVALPSGDLLRVKRYRVQVWQGTTFFFELHKLVVDKKGAAVWVEIKDIGDCCLFLGNAYSISLPASEILGKHRANYIFFTVYRDLPRAVCERSKSEGLDHGMYEIEKEKVEHFCHIDAWRVAPQPMWITPRF